MSVDPIGFAGHDVNLYRYCGNGSTYASDPSGLDGEHTIRVDTVTVKFEYSEGSHMFIKGASGHPGKYGQPADDDRTKGTITKGGKSLSTTSKIYGQDVCNTINGSWSINFGSIRAKAFLYKDCTYEILWSWDVKGSRTAVGARGTKGGGSVEIKRHVDSRYPSRVIDIKESSVHVGQLVRTVITPKKTGWYKFGEYIPTLSHQKKMAGKTEVTGKIGIIRIDNNGCLAQAPPDSVRVEPSDPEVEK